MKIDHAGEITTLETNSKTVLDTQRDEWEGKVNEKIETYEKRLEELINSYEDKIKRLIEEYELRIKQLEQQLENERNNASSSAKEREAELLAQIA
jgi:predicted component of type VI protein secretion system